jgi:polysaccharide export outer membrane protein
MVREVVEFRKLRIALRLGGWGLAVCLGAGWISVQAQEAPVAAAVESVTTAKDSAVAAKPAAAPGHEAGDYTVSPEDLVDVFVMDVPEVTRTYRISSNGFLTLPLLPEPIAAAGLPLNQLSRLIAAKFREAGMLNNAQVTVSLRETRLHSVIISGSVRRPQAYPVYGPTKLLDLLTQAGGLADDAGNEAIVTRGQTGLQSAGGEGNPAAEADPTPKEQTFTLDIKKLVETGEDKTNILLYPGDRVTVQRAALIYILGAVSRPGGYALRDPREQVTVLKALAMAGDTTSVAKKKHITVLRKDPAAPEGKRQEIAVNLKAMLTGQIADLKLQSDDILYVPESSGLKAMRQALGTGIGAGTALATGLLIYH